jgi:hypothetical protein
MQRQAVGALVLHELRDERGHSNGDRPPAKTAAVQR